MTDTGVKAFVLVGRYPGSHNPTARALGKVGALTLEAARAQAREWLKQIGAGVDPAHAAVKAEGDTLCAISQEYFTREGGRLRSVDNLRSSLDRLILPVLGAHPISTIRRSDVVRLLDKVQDERGPIAANRCLALIRRVMNWHATRSDDFHSPIVRGMARPRVARDRVLTDDEIRAVWQDS